MIKSSEETIRVDKVICSDRTLLKQLMTILYDNALKYTDEDGEIQFEVQLKDKIFF